MFVSSRLDIFLTQKLKFVPFFLEFVLQHVTRTKCIHSWLQVVENMRATWMQNNNTKNDEIQSFSFRKKLRKMVLELWILMFVEMFEFNSTKCVREYNFCSLRLCICNLFTFAVRLGTCRIHNSKRSTRNMYNWPASNIIISGAHLMGPILWWNNNNFLWLRHKNRSHRQNYGCTIVNVIWLQQAAACTFLCVQKTNANLEINRARKKSAQINVHFYCSTIEEKMFWAR